MKAWHLLLWFGMTVAAGAQTVAHERLLDKVKVEENCHWTESEVQRLTPAEKDCYRTTPDYNTTMAYLRSIQQAHSTQVHLEAFGRTGEGRELNVVVVSRDGVFEPGDLHRARRPIVLVQNSIHAGEMDGKDACLALLRDMVVTRTQASLLERAVFVFIPIYNADGHERRSPYNRINQDGPEEIGWRANGTNLNLNRDYMKADAPETRAFLTMFHRWRPDFFVDDHVTDGADFQYDVTYAIDDGPNVAPETAAWVDAVITPGVAAYVNAHGHKALPTYVELVNEKDLTKGLAAYDDPPRFSTGYATLENRPAMLIEMHMLKDYKTRVTGNYETLAGLLALVNREADKLLALNQQADARAAAWAGKLFPLATAWGGETTPVQFEGFDYKREKSAISGTDWVAYTHAPKTFTLARQTGAKVSTSVTVPVAYILPGAWSRVIDVLGAHGITMRRTPAAWTGEVESYRCSGMTWQGPPFEGRHPTFNGEAAHDPGKYGQCQSVTETRTYPAGSVVIETAQQLAPVAIEWLEPSAPDSALQWGFFDPIFEQKEYGEAYVVERLAREMMAADPALRKEFEDKLKADKQFRANAAARLDFFYQRSPWGKANEVGRYPVGRLKSIEGTSLAR